MCMCWCGQCFSSAGVLFGVGRRAILFSAHYERLHWRDLCLLAPPALAGDFLGM